MKKGMQEMMKQQPAGAAAADWRGRIGSYWMEMGGDSLRSFEKRKPNLPGKGRISAALRVGVRSGAGELMKTTANAEVLHHRGNFLVRRQRLAPGEAAPWHRDPFHRVTVVLSGDLLKRASSVRSARRSSIQLSLCIWIAGMVKAKVALAQLTKSGDYTSLRRLFAFLGRTMSPSRGTMSVIGMLRQR